MPVPITVETTVAAHAWLAYTFGSRAAEVAFRPAPGGAGGTTMRVTFDPEETHAVEALRMGQQPPRRRRPAYERAGAQGRDPCGRARLLTVDYGISKARALAEWAERAERALEVGTMP